jgi:integrase
MKKALNDKHPKYGLLFELGIDTGLRISDLLNLRVGVVRACRASNFELYIIQRKTRQPVIVSLSESILERVEKYIRLWCLDDGDCIFYSTETHRDVALSRQHVWRVFRAMGRGEGLSGIGTHTMRRTFAARHYLTFKNIKKLQERLGHRFVSSTLNYLMQSDGSLIDL